MFYNQNKKHSESYDLLKRAKTISFEDVQKKYVLFLNKSNYGKFINDELSVSCYWLGKYTEGYTYLTEILDDPDFENVRERLNLNETHFKNKMKS